jgi:squalene cyclase
MGDAGSAVESAIGGCVAFILRRQSPEGCWTDWDLPPGPSGPWTTAYIGEQLALAPGQLGSSTVAQRNVAARWLLDHQRDGGWAYNDRVECDADSTAHAILFLWRQGPMVPWSTYETLLAFQRPDGGFSTYPGSDGLGSWGLSHPDVSAVACRALLTRYEPGHPAIERAVEYLRDQRAWGGTWNSFWWRSPLYATQASLSLFGAAHAWIDFDQTRQTLERMNPENPFERALLLDSLLQVQEAVRSDRIDRLARQLVEEQRPDGSWGSEPILRVTNRDCARPWEHADAGVVYEDPRRLFTTATVLRALSRFVMRSGSSLVLGTTRTNDAGNAPSARRGGFEPPTRCLEGSRSIP